MKSSLYKAIILDADGTIMPARYDALPSETVTKALRKAAQKIHVCIATSRPHKDIKNVLDHLNLPGFSIINGGSQIIDSKTRKIIWEMPLKSKDVRLVYDILKNEIKVPFWFNDGNVDIFIPPQKIPRKVFQIYIRAKFKNSIADSIIDKISHIPGIAIHKVPSWDKGFFDLIITHALATKQHGIFELSKLLGVKTNDMIGVGDGYNDFPLLLSCGLKVAMGNAVSELKEIADYIAPGVEEDGLVDVIERFVF